jgi:hypothetical protein
MSALTIAGATMTPAPIAKAIPYDGTQAFEPRGINEAMQLATLLVASRLLPRSVGTPEAAFAIIATGRELGLTAMQSLRTIHVIEGKPTLSADLVAALVKSRRDICTYFMLVESTDRVARYETQRVGEPKPTVMAFTIEEAQRAGVSTKDNWKKYPAAMLRARCITALARAVYPDLAMGVYDEDELEPLPAPATERWVAEPPAKPRVDSSALMTSFFDRIDAAESGAELNKVASGSMKALKDGVITDADLDRVAVAVAAKRKALRDAVPTSLSPQQLDGQAAADAAVAKAEAREPGEEG